jgi:hypothetical protein
MATTVEPKENLPIEVKDDTPAAVTDTVTGDAQATLKVPDEDEFTDALGENHREHLDTDDDDEGDVQAGDAVGLSMVISALQKQQKEKDTTPTPDTSNNNNKEGLAIDTSKTSAHSTSGGESSQPGTPVPGDLSSSPQDTEMDTAATNKKPELSVHTESVRKSLDLPADKNMADYVTPPTPGLAPPSTTELPNEHSDQEHSQTNTVMPGKIDLKSVSANIMGPREQEKYGK